MPEGPSQSMLLAPLQLWAWLQSGEASDQSLPLLLDLRPAGAFAAGHLPDAVHLDLFGMDTVNTEPAVLDAFLGRLEALTAACGVSDLRAVVVYDEHSGYRAARAFWVLECLGHPDVRLLDGGFGAWADAGLGVTTRVRPQQSSSWIGRRDRARVAGWRDVYSRLGQPESMILDTRSRAEYAGTAAYARRAGAIPGAVHLEWTLNLGPRGMFQPREALRALYERAGVWPDQDIVTYCHGGYRSAHSYLVLRLLGYPRVRNYVGSWQEWGNRDDLPIMNARTPSWLELVGVKLRSTRGRLW